MKRFKGKSRLEAESLEFSAAETRLAATEVNSAAALGISNNDDANQSKVIQRLKDRFGLNNDQAAERYRRMVQELLDSDLTINFRADQLFMEDNVHSFQNAFERTRDIDILRVRDYGENRMFKYNDIKSSTKVNDVINRITRKGDWMEGKNSNFNPSIRPKYGALNLFKHKRGSASNYGDSFLVLKEYVKHRCTFTSGDSFLGPGAFKLGNILHMAAVLHRMPNNAFDILYRISRNETIRIDKDLVGYFIEAQIHSEIMINRDVAKIYLDKHELLLGDSMTENQLSQKVSDFCHQNHISVEYLD